MFRIILLLAFTSALSENQRNLAHNYGEERGNHVDGEELLYVDSFKAPGSAQKTNLTINVFYDGSDSIHNLTCIESFEYTDSRRMHGQTLDGGVGKTFNNETRTAYDATYFTLVVKYYGFKLE